MSLIVKKYLLLRYIALAFFLVAGDRVLAQINVTPAQAALSLAQKLVGKGVTIQNVTMKCPSQANGLFTAAQSIMGLDSGIVLTTGRAATQVSSFGVDGAAIFLASTNNNAPGDASLNSLAGQNTYDACSLEFDVLPQGDTLSFNYVFSSEEYMNAVCGPYNDAFAFFISGPGITGQQNMALVPGTNIPVTINSVNDGIPGQGHTLANCTAMGPGSPFTAYYIDNSHGLYLTHNGHTTVLQARHAVSPCNAYHLKIVIADAGNALYDSGVFLQAGSLQTGSYSVAAVQPSVPATLSVNVPYGIKGCLPGHFTVSRSSPGIYPQSVHYTFGGDAVPGIDYTVASDSVVIPAGSVSADVEVDGLVTPNNGIKKVQIFINLPGKCTGPGNVVDSSSLILYDTFAINMLTPDTAVCTGVPFLLRVNGPEFLSYQWSPQKDILFPLTQDPLAIVQAATRFSVSGNLAGTSCSSNTVSVNVAVKQSPLVTVIGNTKVCMHQPLSLTTQVVPPGNGYTYQWSGPGGYISSAADPEISSISADGNGIYTVKVTNDTNLCVGVDSVQVRVMAPDTPIVISPQIVCENKKGVQLTATGHNLKWYTSLTDTIWSDTAPAVYTNVLATYNYYVSQTVGGCESGRSDIAIQVEKCCDGNIFIPDAFTPNNDGLNDKFEIKRDYGYTIDKLQIYNRWGQLIFDGHGDNGWDGRFGGVMVDVGCYYYYLQLSCLNGGQVERKGSVIVIR